MSSSRRIREQADPVTESRALRAELDAAVDELQRFVQDLNAHVRGMHADEHDEGDPDE